MEAVLEVFDDGTMTYGAGSRVYCHPFAGPDAPELPPGRYFLRTFSTRDPEQWERELERYEAAAPKAAAEVWSGGLVTLAIPAA